MNSLKMNWVSLENLNERAERSPRTTELSKGALRRMNIPKRLWTVDYERVEDSIKKIVEMFLLRIRGHLVRGLGLTLWGDTGLGKTSLAIICMLQARMYAKSAYFVSSEELFDASLNRARYNDAQTVIERCKTVDLLVIDDIGKERVSSEKGKEMADGLIVSVFRKRYHEMRATILTSNLGPAEMLKKYGESHIDVMNHVNNFVHFEGESLRQ